MITAAPDQKNIELVRKIGRYGSESGLKGDLFGPCYKKFHALGVIPFNGVKSNSNGELTPLTGYETEDEQPPIAYFEPKPHDGEPFLANLSPHDVIEDLKNGRSFVATLAFDIILNSADKKLIMEALSNETLKLPYTFENREAIRAAMKDMIERAGFEVLAFLGKPTEFRHLYSKDGVFCLEDAISKYDGNARACVVYKFGRIYRTALERAGFDVDELERRGLYREVERNLDAFLFGDIKQRKADMGADVVESAETIKSLSEMEHGLQLGEKIIDSESALVAYRKALNSKRGSLIKEYGGKVRYIAVPNMEEQDPMMFYNPHSFNRISVLENLRLRRQSPETELL